MRNVFISVDKLGRVVCDGEQLGFSGEHNAVTVTVEFAEDAESFNSAHYFRFITDGRYSDELFLNDNVLIFTLPQECMIPPEVGCQIVGYTVDNGEPIVIVKTEVFKLKVDYSEVPCEKLHSEPDVFERAMEKCRVAAETAVESAAKASNDAESAARSEQVCTEKSALAQTSAQSAYDSALSAVKSAEALSKAVYEVNNVANALKGTASGSVVAIKDVSPLEHDIKVKVSGETVGNTGLTKTETLSEQWDSVSLDTPADTVRATFSEGNHYCAAGIIPLVDGQDLATLSDFSGLVIQPCYSYGEMGGVTDITYTINGNVLSWQGTKTFDDGSPDSYFDVYEVSGSYTLNSSGQKITGFCQVYGLNEDNPFHQNPEEDSITVTVSLYEGSSVGVVVHGKNFFQTSSVELTGKTTSKVLYTGRLYGAVAISWEQSFLAASASQNGFISVKNITTNTTKWLVANSEGQSYRATRTVDLGEGEYEIKLVNGAKFSGEITKLQLEFGNTATEYEPYRGVLASYSVNADSTVDGVRSIYPSMTFIPDTEGTTVEVEYNRDINKAFAELSAAVISLGGNV